MLKHIKKLLRLSLSQFGLVVRSVGHASSVTGVELVHDVNVRLGKKNGIVLFDVGANVGQTLDEFLQAFSQPQIYSFEPSPATFQQLQQKYGQRANVRLEHLALSDREGTQPFYVTRNYSVNDSLLKPAWDAGAREVPVPVETLDRYCESQGISRIDLLKIDTQGNDLNVLQGATRMLDAGQIQFFSLELMYDRMYEGQPTLLDVLSFADQYGYRLLGFYEQTYVANKLNYLNACFEHMGRNSDGKAATTG